MSCGGGDEKIFAIECIPTGPMGGGPAPGMQMGGAPMPGMQMGGGSSCPMPCQPSSGPITLVRAYEYTSCRIKCEPCCPCPCSSCSEDESSGSDCDPCKCVCGGGGGCQRGPPAPKLFMPPCMPDPCPPPAPMPIPVCICNQK